MDALVLEGVPIAGVPENVRLRAGQRYAAVTADGEQARLLADLVTGLTPAPDKAVVRSGGPVRLVPADGGLLPHLSVLQNLVRSYRLMHRSVPKALAADTCRASAGRYGLGEVLDRYPCQITPGHRRRAGVARALCAGAKVIVLEDLAGLPTWGNVLDVGHDPELLRAALLLVVSRGAEPGRTGGFVRLAGA
ncbi:MAG TPA: hypothetical protein VFM37_14410 [Pseudonocardiaceae bacterium]|nr:hypothetical protein [Pseudonocardiaceae bacterium]